MVKKTRTRIAQPQYGEDLTGDYDTGPAAERDELRATRAFVETAGGPEKFARNWPKMARRLAELEAKWPDV